MKKIFLGFLLVAGILNISLAKEGMPFVGVPIKDAVNVRSGANVNFEVLYKLNKNESVTILEKKYGWYKVALSKDKANCFISEKYVKTEDGKTGIVTGAKVNIRSKAGLKSTVLGQAKKDDVVDIVAKKENWYEILPTDSCFGWIKQELIKYSEEATPQDSSITQGQATQDQAKEQPAKIQVAKQPVKKQPKQPTATSLVANPKKIELVGKVESIFRIFGAGPNYKLIAQDGAVYYLAIERSLVKGFINKSVKVKGQLSQETSSKYPSIAVESLELVQ